jgi:hypothetical protein
MRVKLAPQVGLEPTTLRLTAGCSAIELLRSDDTHCVFEFLSKIISEALLIENRWIDSRLLLWERKRTMFVQGPNLSRSACFC